MPFVNDVNYELITFDEVTSQGNVSGKHKRNRKYVYLDRDATVAVSVGETWFCELKDPPNYGNYYFAKPVKQLDESYLAHLDDDTLKDVAEFAAKNFPEYLEKYLPKPEPVPVVVPEPVKEPEPEPVVEEESTPLDGVLPRADVGEIPEDVICAIGGNTLRSPMFTDSEYRVCRNVSCTKIQISPENRGAFKCVDNEISVEGLDELIGGSLPVNLKWVSCRGTFIITLPENSTREISREETSGFAAGEILTPSKVDNPALRAEIADFVYSRLIAREDPRAPALMAAVGVDLTAKFGEKCHTKLGFSTMSSMLVSMGFEVDKGVIDDASHPAVIRLSQAQIDRGSALSKSTN